MNSTTSPTCSYLIAPSKLWDCIVDPSFLLADLRATRITSSARLGLRPVGLVLKSNGQPWIFSLLHTLSPRYPDNRPGPSCVGVSDWYAILTRGLLCLSQNLSSLQKNRRAYSFSKSSRYIDIQALQCPAPEISNPYRALPPIRFA
jgi:hypothetical protein